MPILMPVNYCTIFCSLQGCGNRIRELCTHGFVLRIHGFVLFWIVIDKSNLFSNYLYRGFDSETCFQKILFVDSICKTKNLKRFGLSQFVGIRPRILQRSTLVHLLNFLWVKCARNSLWLSRALSLHCFYLLALNNIN